MSITFTPLQTFNSREHGGSVYVKGYTYTATQEKRHDKLRKTIELWLKARLFVPEKDFSFFGIEFKDGIPSYCIADEFQKVVEGMVQAGEAEWIEGSLIAITGIGETSGVQGEG